MPDDVVRVRCDCGRSYKIPKINIKKRIQCPHCHAIIAIPEPPSDPIEALIDFNASSGAEESHAPTPNLPDKGVKPVSQLDAARELKLALLADLGVTCYSLAQMGYLYSLIPSRDSMSGEADRYIPTREEMGVAIALSCALVLLNAFAVVRKLNWKKHSFRLLFAVLFASVPVQVMRIGGGFGRMVDSNLLMTDSGDTAKVGFIVLIGVLTISYDIVWFRMLRRLRATNNRKPPG